MALPSNPNQSEMFVISRTDEGYRVYNPADPTKSYIVGGGPDESTCTCPEFRYHEGDPKYRCKHIQVVLEKLGLAPGEAGGRDPYEAAEHEAIKNEAQPGDGSGLEQMVLKRSVSPDGRIDSLSVEFCCALPGADDDVKRRAFDALRLQDEIVASFLAKANGNGARDEAQSGDGAQPARMVAIGGITTKWGRRLYIAIQANGQALKLFGSRKQVADAIVAAGYPSHAERIEEGRQLDLPCRVVTRPSEDGKYLNIEEVLPAQGARAGR